MAKIKISPRPCRYHGPSKENPRGERAATCQTCYDLALDQQRAQVARERAQAHTEYLRRLGERQYS